MKLSILDQGPVTKGNQAPEALQKAVELARVGEELGYERIWLAEHHNTDAFASRPQKSRQLLLRRKRKKSV